MKASILLRRDIRLEEFVNSHPPVSIDGRSYSWGRPQVYVNGLLQRESSDYTISDGIVTFAQVPRNSDRMSVFISYGRNVGRFDYVADGVTDTWACPILQNT